ncbi:MAG: DUF2157 domain-containing protein [Alphaproteobacteria bacterium]|nr:DUF2157 domain-containing protein [Alphaproteobacteria bacterium]
MAIDSSTSRRGGPSRQLVARDPLREDGNVIAEHYLKRWRGAGLIDDAAVQRISAWEAAHRRPVWLWAVSGMGALAIGLGVVSVVAANWEEIPGSAKLAAALLLTALCAGGVFVSWQRELAWPREIGALLTFGLVLGNIALIGQVYQLQSEAWQGLLTWLALCTPFLALVAFTRLVGALWFAAAIVTWFSADEPIEWLVRGLTGTAYGHFFPLVLYLPACLLIVMAVVRGRWPPAETQGELLLTLSLAGLALAVSATVVALNSRLDFWPASAAAPVEISIGALATLLAAAALGLGRSNGQRRPLIALLGVSFAVWTVALLLSRAWHAEEAGEATFEAVFGLLFIVYWSAIGWVAARTGHRVVFGLAFAFVGLRLLILYFEAIGGLTATGLGLIGGGVLCLALAWLGWRLTQRLVHGATP